MSKYTAQSRLALDNLKNLAIKYQVEEISAEVLNNLKFPIWTGSSRPNLHHYGEGGLITHVNEVVNLCLANNDLLNAQINKKLLFLAALFHDVGKMWDYEPILPPYPTGVCLTLDQWQPTQHKRRIHHLTRSALEWQTAARKFEFQNDEIDEVLHAILSHHGLKEWGSPVAPNTKLAWMLHLCDAISARINDADVLETGAKHA